MTEEHRLPSDSDEDDEDYVPEAVISASEAESEGEEEEEAEVSGAENDEEKPGKRSARRKAKTKGSRRKAGKKSTSRNDVKEKAEKDEEEKKLTEEEEKKRADSLWADFMKDTAPAASASPRVASKPEKPEEKIKVTKVFEFAGEEVKVEREVSAKSTEVVGRGAKRCGISSVLGQLGKRAKISTLEKSKLDWDNYKKQENLEEEISNHNRGKGGYLERQDFLQRADLRQFEIEKRMRSASRRSR